MENETHIWTYIHASDFDLPCPPASDAARGLALRLWKSAQNILSQQKRKAESKKPQLDRPPLILLKSMFPDPDWRHAARQLANTLGDDWFENRDPARLIHAFVAPPGVDIAETLQRLAQQKRLSLLAAPSSDVLLRASSSDTKLDEVDETSSEILVFPHLQRWYLRHEDGLTMVRNLLERLILLRKRVLLGCDSWAWAFLQQAVGIEDMLGEPQTLAPFDAKRLDGWFRSTFDFQGHEFRQSDNDELVFPDLPNAEKEERETSTMIASLAAKARGNPGVALAIWRACVRTCDARDASAPVTAVKSVFWVTKLDDLAPPDIHFDVDRVHRFILHSVLLHGGLSPSSLDAILPFSRNEIQRRVNSLRRAGILDEQDERLRVTLTAYPLIRRDLQNEGFLTDAF